MKFHHTMGVYNSGQRKHNGVHPAHLARHIEYNKTMRFGRALFVDGKCVNLGYLSAERCAAIEEELRLNPVVMERDTAPYH
jgi:hypothetical protein